MSALPRMPGITFTHEQERVIEHRLPAHGRVLAGPGTGKSTTAVALVRRLLGGQDHPALRFLTFTRAATAELARKLTDAAPEVAERPSTIHSFALSVLLRNPGCAAFPAPRRIPDEYERTELIEPHLARCINVRVTALRDLIREMAAKWECLVPEEHPAISRQLRARFLGAWQVHRSIFGYTLLAELPDLLRTALRDHDPLIGVDFSLLVVDEYQDLNACDLEVLRRLVDRGASMLAIGDDDQSIYSFRRAHPAGIRRFLEEYQTDCDYPLTICQRSPRRIIEWSQHVIQGDPDRTPRDAPRFRDDAPQGVAKLLRFRSEQREARGVADLVLWLVRARGVLPSEILILSRTDYNRAFSAPIKAELDRRDIPVSDPNAIKQLLAEPPNRRLLAILHLLVRLDDSLAWWALIRATPGLGQRIEEILYAAAQQKRGTFGRALITAAADGFEALPAQLRGRTTGMWQEVGAIREQIGALQPEGQWGRWIVERVTAGRLPACSPELQRLLLDLDELVEADESLDRFLGQIEPLGKDLAQTHSQGVRFMTMTGSKGLTTRATIVVGVEDDLIPRPDQDVNEERRLLYVAMTRSNEFLFLTWTTRRRGPTARAGRANAGLRTPSRFLQGGPVEPDDGETFIRGL